MGLSTNEKRLVKNLVLKKDLFILQRIVLIWHYPGGQCRCLLLLVKNNFKC